MLLCKLGQTVPRGVMFTLVFSSLQKASGTIYLGRYLQIILDNTCASKEGFD